MHQPYTRRFESMGDGELLEAAAFGPTVYRPDAWDAIEQELAKRGFQKEVSSGTTSTADSPPASEHLTAFESVLPGLAGTSDETAPPLPLWLLTFEAYISVEITWLVSVGALAIIEPPLRPTLTQEPAMGVLRIVGALVSAVGLLFIERRRRSAIMFWRFLLGLRFSGLFLVDVLLLRAFPAWQIASFTYAMTQAIFLVLWLKDERLDHVFYRERRA